MRISDWSSDVCSSDLYIRNLATNHDDPEVRQQLARLTLKWEPSANFDYTVKAEYANRDVIGGITVSSPLDGPQDPQTTRYPERSAPGDAGMQTESLMLSGTGNIAPGEYTPTPAPAHPGVTPNQ